MKVLEGASLARVKEKDCARLDRHYVQQDNGLWTESEEAGAVAFYPVSDSPIEGKVNFLFKEAMPAEGVKGPDNPSTINGVSSINLVRANSNLLPYPYWLSSPTTANGITYTVNSDGSVSVTGTADSNTSSYFPFLNSNTPSTNGVYLTTNLYKFSGSPVNGSWNTYGITCIPGIANTIDTMSYDYGAGGTIKLAKPGRVSFAIRIANGTTISNLVFYPMLSLVNAPYEKNEQNTYTYSLGNTYYGGSINLATGVMTVTHKADTLTHDGRAGSVLTNTINLWCFSSSRHHGGSNNIYWACNKFPCLSPNNADVEHIRPTGNPSTGTYDVALHINKSRLDISGAVDPLAPTDAEWRAAGNAWLAENPVLFVYKLFTPFTVQLDPVQISALTQTDKYTPRLNTIYSDAESVQIRYKKSPIREAYEQRQAIASIGGV